MYIILRVQIYVIQRCNPRLPSPCGGGVTGWLASQHTWDMHSFPYSPCGGVLGFSVHDACALATESDSIYDRAVCRLYKYVWDMRGLI